MQFVQSVWAARLTFPDGRLARGSSHEVAKFLAAECRELNTGWRLKLTLGKEKRFLIPIGGMTMFRSNQYRRSVSLITALLSVLLGGCASWLRAEVKLPRVISNNMVLQQGMRVAIWGWAAPQESVKVSFRDQRATTTASAEGRWRIQLSPLNAGGPDDLVVSGKNTIRVKNVLVGEVWVCSGQSNMEMHVGPMETWRNKGVINAEQEIASAHFPSIRMFTVTKATATKPQEDVEGDWREASPVTVGDFSAVGYFFARELHKAMGVPVGMLHSSWGGSIAEAWTSRGALESDPELKTFFDDDASKLDAYFRDLADFEKKYQDWKVTSGQAEAAGKPVPPPPFFPWDYRVNKHRPSGLYNAMMAPLTPYAIKGAIWYQGESNTDRSIQYRKLFALMIRDWRRAWGLEDFPFLFVQLANFEGMGPDYYWPLLREAQLMTLRLPKTGMAVTVDIGETHDIHPRNKQELGRRLALAAQGVAYGHKVVYSGPTYRSSNTEGEAVRVSFDQVDGGLIAQGGSLRGFQIAGQDRKFVPAEAKIVGETVVVRSSQVKQPVAVRYGWTDDPACNLYNQSGLPASPFRSDDWPIEGFTK